jgi:hypothetical protein
VVDFLSNQLPCYRDDSAGLEFVIAPTQAINKECLGALSELYQVLRDDAKEEAQHDTGEGADRFLDQMMRERIGEDEAFLESGPDAEVVVFQGRKTNLYENSEIFCVKLSVDT